MYMTTQVTIRNVEIDLSLSLSPPLSSQEHITSKDAIITDQSANMKQAIATSLQLASYLHAYMIRVIEILCTATICSVRIRQLHYLHYDKERTAVQLLYYERTYSYRNMHSCITISVHVSYTVSISSRDLHGKGSSSETCRVIYIDSQHVHCYLDQIDLHYLQSEACRVIYPFIAGVV